jgi:hypothetical protein
MRSESALKVARDLKRHFQSRPEMRHTLGNGNLAALFPGGFRPFEYDQQTEEPAPAAAHAFHLTCLQAHPRGRLCKAYTYDGRKLSYDNAAEFTVELLPVDSFASFSSHLLALEQQRNRCIIRGAPSAHYPGGPVRRTLYKQPCFVDDRGRRFTEDDIDKRHLHHRIGVDLHEWEYFPMFKEVPTPWAALDFDKFEGDLDWRFNLLDTAYQLVNLLPDEFQDVSCVYMATGSAADPTKDDWGGRAVKMRLWFMLDRPLTQGQLKAWLGGVRGLDDATFGIVQPIYTARPLFMGRLRDPMPVRSGVLQGLVLQPSILC